MPTALVLDSGSGPSLAAVRSLGRAGWRVGVVAGTRSERSRHASFAVPVPDTVENLDGFAAAVLDAVRRHRPQVVVPATDGSVETLWRISEALGDVRILGADRASAELALDKSRMLAAADEHGFATPQWHLPGSEDELRAAVTDVGTPAVLKARRSYHRVDGRLEQRRHAFVDDPAQVAAVLPRLVGDAGELPVVQAYVPGRSLSVSAVVQSGRVVALAARETLSFDPIGGGTSVWKRTIAPDDTGVEQAVELLLAIGFEGIGEVEYQVGEDGVPRLMEVGVRLHGWVALAVAAGVDLPLRAARALLGEELPEDRRYRAGVQMRWPAGELSRLRAVARRRVALPPGVRRRDVLAKAWPPWAPGMRYDGLELTDIRPWLRPARRRSAAR